MSENQKLIIDSGENSGEAVNYKQLPSLLDTTVADWYDRNVPVNNDQYTQAGIFYRQVLSEDDKKNLINNIVYAMKSLDGPKKNDLVLRQICYFFRADIGLGMAIAQGLGLDMNSIQQQIASGLKQGGAPA